LILRLLIEGYLEYSKASLASI